MADEEYISIKLQHDNVIRRVAVTKDIKLPDLTLFVECLFHVAVDNKTTLCYTAVNRDGETVCVAGDLTMGWLKETFGGVHLCVRMLKEEEEEIVYWQYIHPVVKELWRLSAIFYVLWCLVK